MGWHTAQLAETGSIGILGMLLLLVPEDSIRRAHLCFLQTIRHVHTDQTPWGMLHCRLPALLKAKGRAGWEAVRENLLLVLKQLDVEAQV